VERQIILTKDGSNTIYLPDLNEYYHSKNGAIQESLHVFIKNGFDAMLLNSKIAILEIGFGTGLNCFMTYIENLKHGLSIDYTGIEAYPITLEEMKNLNFTDKLKAFNGEQIYKDLHLCAWNTPLELSSNFTLTKRRQFIQEVKDKAIYDLIYFDAFGPQVQPELWTKDIFLNMYNALNKDGILVTYSAKGSVRRAMLEVGFMVERLPGPPGKRHVLRAKKI
jgi:tRNA U34 5-methylaminomethyl-2-thiouridine-forming methyltransferase MnmC